MNTTTNALAAILHRIHALLTSVLLYILSFGPIPSHVGFVMDGNRRYAMRRGMKIVQGHHDGFHSLRRVGAFPSTNKRCGRPDVRRFSKSVSSYEYER